MIAHEVEKLRGNFRKAAHQQPLTLNFRAQSKHLALQCGQEEAEPGAPVRTVGPDRPLGLPQCQVIGLFALLDHAFEG